MLGQGGAFFQRTLKLKRGSAIKTKSKEDKRDGKPEDKQEQRAHDFPSLRQGESDEKNHLEDLREELAEDEREEQGIVTDTAISPSSIENKKNCKTGAANYARICD